MKPNMMIEPTVSQQEMKRNMTTCAEIKPRKTCGVALMKTLHCLIAGLRLAFSNAASRIADSVTRSWHGAGVRAALRGSFLSI